MRITFLGTGAAASCPLTFCRCAFCEAARRNGGRDLRKRSSLLVNGDLLIDLGPDIMPASFMHGISIAGVRYCLQTHWHGDHFDASHLDTRTIEYAAENVLPLDLYASAATLARMSDVLSRATDLKGVLAVEDQRRLHLCAHPVQALESFAVGTYEVSAFAANHGAPGHSLLYSISEGGFTLFYGTDTDAFPQETWRGFRDKKMRFDIVVLDHTFGPGADGAGHLNARRFAEHVQRMHNESLLTPEARIFATHISHEGNLLHNELVEYAAARGYEIAYDGLVV